MTLNISFAAIFKNRWRKLSSHTISILTSISPLISWSPHIFFLSSWMLNWKLMLRNGLERCAYLYLWRAHLEIPLCTLLSRKPAKIPFLNPFTPRNRNKRLGLPFGLEWNLTHFSHPIQPPVPRKCLHRWIFGCFEQSVKK